MPDPSDHLLVTGGAGFIGSHTCHALLALGCRVTALDNFDPFYDRSLKEHSVSMLAAAGSDRFQFVEADIRRAPEMQQLFQAIRPTAVIHLAARAGVRPSITHPALYAQVNLEGTINLLEAARQCDSVTRFVQASSSSIYGNNSKIPFAETDPVEDPISPYAATKRAVELIAHTYHHLYDLPIASLRFFTVFGPRQRPDLAIAKFIRMIDQGQPIPVFGDGDTSRDYTYIDDIVEGVLSACDRIADHGERVWNLGGSNPVTLSTMIATIAEALGREPIIDRQPLQPGDVARTWADLSRSGSELAYSPRTRFEEGIAKQVDWYRSLHPSHA